MLAEWAEWAEWAECRRGACLLGDAGRDSALDLVLERERRFFFLSWGLLGGQRVRRAGCAAPGVPQTAGRRHPERGPGSPLPHPHWGPRARTRGSRRGSLRVCTQRWHDPAPGARVVCRHPPCPRAPRPQGDHGRWRPTPASEDPTAHSENITRKCLSVSPLCPRRPPPRVTPESLPRPVPWHSGKRPVPRGCPLAPPPGTALRCQQGPRPGPGPRHPARPSQEAPAEVGAAQGVVSPGVGAAGRGLAPGREGSGETAPTRTRTCADPHQAPCQLRARAV